MSSPDLLFSPMPAGVSAAGASAGACEYAAGAAACELKHCVEINKTADRPKNSKAFLIRHNSLMLVYLKVQHSFNHMGFFREQ
jgi:hypothetical protein